MTEISPEDFALATAVVDLYTKTFQSLIEDVQDEGLDEILSDRTIELMGKVGIAIRNLKKRADTLRLLTLDGKKFDS